WNYRAKLVPGKILQNRRGRTDQRLPEKLQNRIFLEVLAEAEELQVAEQRFDIAADLPLVGLHLDHQIKPSSFEIELPVRQRQIVDLRHIQAKQPRRNMESRPIRKRIECHNELKLRLVHRQRRHFYCRDQWLGFVVNVGEIVDRQFDL